MQERPRTPLTEVLILAVAVIVPLAGAVLAVLEASRGERTFALRIAAATILGVCLYALLFA